MSKRLQVLLTEAEMEEIRRAARRQGLPVGEWARRAMRTARQRQPVRAAAEKLAAVRTAVALSYPTADIEQMLGETEQGRL